LLKNRKLKNQKYIKLMGEKHISVVL